MILDVAGAPAPAIVGAPHVDTAPSHNVTRETPEQSGLEAFGLDLPPLSGGTSFGAEFATAPRTRWKSRRQFVLVLMGYCIGVGNLWRFPYLCGKYGGGAFIVAYLCSLFFCALPLFFYECVLGQKFQRAPAETFRKMAPKWIGLAYVPVAMTLCFLPYYQCIVTYAFHYFWASFQSPLPWVDGTTADKYLDSVVLWRTSSLTEDGSSRVHDTLLVENFLVWVITGMCLVKGIHSAGKAAYVTVILPVIMLVLLFLVCIGLEGAGNGLHYYLTPRFEYLFKPEVWGIAAGQIIFSLSPGMGCCIALSSFHDPEYRGLFQDSCIIGVCNSAFSLFGGLVVFSVVGHIALIQGRAVEDVAASGEGLAFIVFAEGLASIGGGVSSFFAASFFLTLFLLGLDSTFATVETLQTYLNDWILKRYPGDKITQQGHTIRLLVVCSVLFLAGIPYNTRGGYYLLEVMDHYLVTYVLTTTVFLEYIMIGWVYTAEQLLQDVRDFTDIELPSAAIWQIKVVGPMTVSFALLLLVAAEIQGESLDVPKWCVWLFGILPVLFSLSFFIAPWVAFRVWRLLTSGIAAPDMLEQARKRAQSGGYRDHGLEPTDADDVSLSQNRA